MLFPRQQDLEDLLTDPNYFQAIFMGLPKVQELMGSLLELGRANEALASKWRWMIGDGADSR